MPSRLHGGDAEGRELPVLRERRVGGEVLHFKVDLRHTSAETLHVPSCRVGLAGALDRIAVLCVDVDAERVGAR